MANKATHRKDFFLYLPKKKRKKSLITINATCPRSHRKLEDYLKKFKISKIKKFQNLIRKHFSWRSSHQPTRQPPFGKLNFISYLYGFI